MRRIIVVRAGALGDVVLTIPAVRALRERYPGARIEVVGYPALWEVAGPLAERTISIERPALGGLLTGKDTPELLAWLRGESNGAEDVTQPVDLAICWTTRDAVPVFEAAGVSHIVHTSPFPPPGIHAATWYLQSLDLRYPASDEPLLLLTGEERRAGHQALRDLHLQHPVILHPGAGAEWKRWPAPRFGALARALRERGHDVALLEGPADGEVVRATLEHAGSLPVLRSTSVRRLAGMLSQARLFVGNDSGATHLAAASGTPTIALFGPTDPATWSPLGKVRVLRACTVHGERVGLIRVCEDPACMEGIEVEEVLEECEV